MAVADDVHHVIRGPTVVVLADARVRMRRGPGLCSGRIACVGVDGCSCRTGDIGWRVRWTIGCVAAGQQMRMRVWMRVGTRRDARMIAGVVPVDACTAVRVLVAVRIGLGPRRPRVGGEGALVGIIDHSGG